MTTVAARKKKRRWPFPAAGARPRVVHRRGLLWERWPSLLFLTSSFFLLIYLFLSGGFRVSAPEVQGNRVTSEEAIAAASGAQGQSIFTIDPQEIARKVATLPDIAKVWVQLSLPNQLTIAVAERSPHVLWQSGEITYLVDSSAVVLSPQETMVSLTIRDQEGQSLKPGDIIDSQILRTAEAYHTVDPTLTQFDYDPDQGLSIVTLSGARVLLGNEENAAEKLALLRALEEHLKYQGIYAQLIDLRYEVPHFVKLE